MPTQFLSIAGTTYQVLTEQEPTEEASEFLGSKERAWDGSLHVQANGGEPRSWTFPLAPISPTAYATLRSDVAGGAFVACDGVFDPACPIQCIVTINRAPFYKPKGGTTASLYRMPIVTLTETL